MTRWRLASLRHRSERPSTWATVEEPLDLGSALSSTTDQGTVVIDCLTLWVANLLGAGRTDAEVLASAGTVAVLAGERPGKVVVVSNEVGSGIVPGDALSRRYRDLLGRVNSVFAEQAADAFLVVAGLVVPLMPAPAMAGQPGRRHHGRRHHGRCHHGRCHHGRCQVPPRASRTPNGERRFGICAPLLAS